MGYFSRAHNINWECFTWKHASVTCPSSEPCQFHLIFLNIIVYRDSIDRCVVRKKIDWLIDWLIDWAASLHTGMIGWWDKLSRGYKVWLHQDGHFDPPSGIEGMTLHRKCALTQKVADSHTQDVAALTREMAILPREVTVLTRDGMPSPLLIREVAAHTREVMCTPGKWLSSPGKWLSLPNEAHRPWPLTRGGQVTSQGGPTSWWRSYLHIYTSSYTQMAW